LSFLQASFNLGRMDDGMDGEDALGRGKTRIRGEKMGCRGIARYKARGPSRFLIRHQRDCTKIPNVIMPPSGERDLMVLQKGKADPKDFLTVQSFVNSWHRQSWLPRPPLLLLSLHFIHLSCIKRFLFEFFSTNI
jgi:hypothetical protein